MTSHQSSRFMRIALGFAIIPVLAVTMSTAQSESNPPLSPDKQKLLDVDAKTDGRVDDGPIPTGMQQEAADRITKLLTPRGEKPADGVPVSFDIGIIGVTGSPTDGYTLVVGRGEDAIKVKDDALAGLPAEAKSIVGSKVASRSTGT